MVQRRWLARYIRLSAGNLADGAELGADTCNLPMT
jgi:hypothetical protein